MTMPEPTRVTRIGRRRVLIAEDESLVALDLAHSLRDAGFDVIDTVASGDEALRVGRTLRPDLVLMDIRLEGERDGIDTATELVAELGVPVVYLTAHSDERTLERAVRTEPYGYLLKPVNPRELRTAVELALYKHEVAGRLRRSEAQLAEAQRIAHVGSFEWFPHADHCSWSAELYRILGRAPGERASVKLLLESVHPEERPAFDAALHDAVRERSGFQVEHRIVRPSGEVRTLRSEGQVLSERGSLRLVATAQDVSEQRALERQMLIASRLSSVGTLASGVAHEINNPMTYVIGNVELAMQRACAVMERVSADCPACAGCEPEAVHSCGVVREALLDVDDLLRHAAHGAERVCQIVRDLKVFSRADDGHKKQPVDLVGVLESSINICWNEIRDRARLEKNYAQLPLVDGNEARLGQVFVNLLMNAAHAVGDGQRERHVIRVHAHLDAENRVVIEVSDTGCGMSEAMQSRIFEPFFTTKPAGVGTGLGLSICHGIVGSLGGQLEVESALGRGTTFRVLLPASSAQQPAKASVLPPPMPQAPRGRILVVDDEPLLAEAIRRMLANEHDVVMSTSARMALTMLTRGEHFDLILSDLMMPDMTGMELYERLRTSLPQLLSRVVLMTGGACTPSAREFLDRVPNPRIHKPFGQRALRDIIHRQLRKVARAVELQSGAS